MTNPQALLDADASDHGPTDAAVLAPPPEGPPGERRGRARPLSTVPAPASGGTPPNDLPPEEPLPEESLPEESPPGESPAVVRHDFTYAHILNEMQDDRRNLRRAFAVAIAFHVVLFFVHLPSLMQPMEVTPAAKQKAYVVQQVRFRPPQAAPRREIPKEKRRKIPIPDPTPQDPEPIRDMTADLPDLDYDLPIGELNLDIPDGPPGPPGPALGDVAHVGGDVLAPVKLHAPRPGYTEEARQARIQGVVMLQVVVDRQGNVTHPVILKPLPMGLADKAVETVLQWKFKPATRNGEPVPVYYNLTVNFSLQ